MGQEIEFKFRVESADALDAFAAELGFAPEDGRRRLQRNTFFDSADARLRQSGLALRLRTEEDRGIVTVKGEGRGLSAEQALVSRFEVETEIARPHADRIFSGDASPLAPLEDSTDAEQRDTAARIRAALDGAELTCLGSFENERRTLPPFALPVGEATATLVFELDRTSFPGERTDFEIEAEIGERSDAAAIMNELKALLARANVSWGSAPSKLSRFLEIVGAS